MVTAGEGGLGFEASPCTLGGRSGWANAMTDRMLAYNNLGGSGRGGTGTFKVDGKVVSTQTMARYLPKRKMISWDKRDGQGVFGCHLSLD